MEITIKSGMHYQTQIMLQCAKQLECKNMSDFAKKVKIPLATVYRYYNGERHITSKNLMKLVKICNITRINIE